MKTRSNVSPAPISLVGVHVMPCLESSLAASSAAEDAGLWLSVVSPVFFGSDGALDGGCWAEHWGSGARLCLLWQSFQYLKGSLGAPAETESPTTGPQMTVCLELPILSWGRSHPPRHKVGQHGNSQSSVDTEHTGLGPERVQGVQ